MAISHPKTRDSRNEPVIALVTDNVFSIMSEHDTLGFIHKAGSVYVALSGDVLSHSVEVGQSLTWEQALQMVRDNAH
ncbi:MAG: hypothetical protein JWQ43_2884 [Glaciihabitans sp.]|nr:hypothetical protein [Glaciihabitans sp.]